MPLSTTVLAALLNSCAPNVAPATMTAIIQVESERDPYRIGVNSGGSLLRQPGNAADAIATARSLMRKGANFDAGLMQINSANFARLGVTPETIFDPCTNLRAGARLLADNYGRARISGHADPLRAALSEYNTGSRSRGLMNGYVRKVFAAADGGAVVRRGSGAIVTVDQVGGILVSAFGGRITDTLRPMNARYGAQNSFHKYGQAVDFVPNGGMSAINRAQIRAVLAASGIQIIELLGPGDRNHSDHWHIAFANGQGAPVVPPYSTEGAPWTVAAVAPAQDVERGGAYQATATLASAELQMGGVAMAEPAPPSWDVFAQAAWRQRQSVPTATGGL
jgi:hypothetical protein